MIEIQLWLIGVIVVCVAFLKAVRDAIAHSDSLAKFGYWFSRDAMEKAKYAFMIKHPFWSTGIGKLIVVNVIVMFLDAWHFAEFLLILSYAATAMIFYPNPFVGFLMWMSISVLFDVIYNKLKAIKK
jgi:hypothetical protein